MANQVFSSPKGIAFLLSVGTGAVITAFMSLAPEIFPKALIVIFFISFASTYVLALLVLDFFILKRIDQVYELLDNLRKKDFHEIKPGDNNINFNPLKKINKEIYNYAQLKQREIDELKKVEEFRKEFIANVSHELKTPLFAAQGFVHTLLDGAVKDKSVRSKFLKKAAKSLDGLDLLVQDLLTLSHIETGEIKMHLENFDIIRLVRDIIDQFEEKAEKKRIILKMANGAPKALYVYADCQRINQVLTNLVSNAIKYNKDKGSVVIGFKKGKEKVKIYVQDDGDGIPAKDIDRIFERFYRVEKSRSREKGGTGLGLAIVKHIMEGHNSKVEVKSTVGKGSVFSFKLKKGKEPDFSSGEEEQ